MSRESAIDGWLILDKPLGISSSDAVIKLGRALRAELGFKPKIGHCGTLDPLASGVLVVAMGEATKLADYVMLGRKEYVFEMTWGQLRSTDDAEGEVLEESSLMPEREQVEEALAAFLPSYMQVPPNYSAIKVGGRRAYKKARAGEDFVLLPRLVQLYEAEVQKHGDGKTVIKIQCGKGFYVRSLAVDIARKLKGLAYVSSLRRVGVGNFSEKDAILLAKEEEVVYSAMVQDCILPVSAVLDDILVQQVSVDQAHKLMNGVALESAAIGGDSGVDEVVVCCGEFPVAICCLDNGLLKPRRVFNLLKKRSVSDVDYKG